MVQSETKPRFKVGDSVSWARDFVDTWLVLEVCPTNHGIKQLYLIGNVHGHERIVLESDLRWLKKR